MRAAAIDPRAAARRQRRGRRRRATDISATRGAAAFDD